MESHGSGTASLLPVLTNTTGGLSIPIVGSGRRDPRMEDLGALLPHLWESLQQLKLAVITQGLEREGK